MNGCGKPTEHMGIPLGAEWNEAIAELHDVCAADKERMRRREHLLQQSAHRRHGTGSVGSKAPPPVHPIWPLLLLYHDILDVLFLVQVQP